MPTAGARRGKGRGYGRSASVTDTPTSGRAPRTTTGTGWPRSGAAAVVATPARAAIPRLRRRDHTAPSRVASPADPPRTSPSMSGRELASWRLSARTRARGGAATATRRLSFSTAAPAVSGRQANPTQYGSQASAPRLNPRSYPMPAAAQAAASGRVGRGNVAAMPRATANPTRAAAPATAGLSAPLASGFSGLTSRSRSRSQRSLRAPIANWIGSMIPTRRSAVTGSGSRWRAAAAAATKQAVTSSEGPG